VGDRGSGAEVNANMVLASASITYSNITPVYENLERSIILLKAGKIDAFFATTRCPSVQLDALLEDPEYVIVGLGREEIERITKGYPNTFEFTIERGTYPNQLQRVPTIHVWALLVVHSEVRDSKVYQLTKTIFENKTFLKKRHPFLELDEKNAASNFRIPLHPGARKYFIEAGVLRGQSLFVSLGAILFVIIAAGGILLRFFLRPLRDYVYAKTSISGTRPFFRSSS
jgi:TRAP transporter TAXI family solute receptor